MHDSPNAFARPPQADQAFCVVHTQTPATGTCSRCGSYACGDCTGTSGTLCGACRERLGIDRFPFSRDAWEVGGLVSHAWSAFKRDAGELIVMTLAVVLIPVIGGIVLQMLGAFAVGSSKVMAGVFGALAMAFQTVASVGLTLGANRLLIDANQGRPLSLGSFFLGMRRIGPALLQYVVIGAPVMVAVGCLIGMVAGGNDTLTVVALVLGLLLIIPGVYVGLGLSFMQLELVNDPSCGALEAMRRSWALASDKRMSMFGAFLVAGVVMMAGCFLCGVGALVSYPVGMLVMAGVYLALRNGSWITEPKFTSGS